MVDVSNLPSAPPRPAATRVKPFLTPDPEGLRQWRDFLERQPDALAPDHGFVEDVGPRAAPPLRRAPAVSVQFEGLTNADNIALTSSSSIPPDDNLGVGPSHIFQMVNVVGRITTKSGAAISSFSLANFFQVDTGFEEADPRVIFDAISARWFAVIWQSSPTLASSSLILAVSTTSDPTGLFCRYRLGNPTTETFEQDFPMLGVSDDKVVVSYNAFAFSSGSFLGAGYYVLNKADLTACAATVPRIRVAPDPTRATPHPAQSLGSTSDLFLAMHASTSTLSLLTVSGIPGVGSVTESLTPLGIRSWTPPPKAQQASSSLLLDTGDERVLSVAWQDQSLWLAGNEACTPSGDVVARSCLRLIEVLTSGPSIRQDMTFAAAAEHSYYPALRPDKTGNVHVVFNRSSATAFVGVRITGRLATDPLNTLQASSDIRAGSGAQTAASGRMGDYSGAAVDPSDPQIVWVTAEYIRSTTDADWGTWIAQLSFPATLFASVLPGSRSGQVGTPVTAFATLINASASPAAGCALSLKTSLFATFSFQSTDPATNQLTGSPNTPVTIPAGAPQSFVFALTPSGPVAPTDVAFNFTCSGTVPAATIVGVNTLLLSASTTPVPDIVALAATPGNDGIVNVPGATGTGVFAVAAANVGAGGALTVTADSGGVLLPLTASLCETNPTTGACISPLAASVATTINANATPTFAVFVTGTGAIPFAPATNRIFVRFRDAGGVTRGATSVAVRTQ